ncbi:hypothetical protein A2U01_0058762, partial [Trifolium medium]|nr:hypothetical protein [Trifolium medium]
GTQSSLTFIVNELSDSHRDSNLERLVKWDSQTMPSNELPHSIKRDNSVSDPMVVGISPFNLLLTRSNTLKDEKIERSGNVPEI